MRILIISLFTLSVMSCSQKKSIQPDVTSAEAVTKDVQTQAEVTYENDCFEDRAVTKEVSDQEASMINIMDQFMFTFESTRWQPCSVPAEFQKEGMKVKVSGEVLEIRPNERRAGTPFKITSLEKME